MKKRILIIDGDAQRRSALRETLCEAYTVSEALDAQSAMPGSPGDPVSAVLVDGVNMREVIEALHGVERAAGIPVIALAEDADRQKEALALGADDCLVAPFLPEALLRRLQNVIRLREASRQVFDIMTNANSSICATTIEDGVPRFIYANDRYFSLLGYTRREFETEVSNALDLVHPEDRERILAAIGDILSTGRANSYEYRCYSRDGRQLHLRCNASFAQMDGVKGRVLLSVIHDITEQKSAEQRLSLSSARLQAIVSSIAGGVTATVVGEDGKVDFIFVTNRFYDLLGYTRAQYKAEVNSPFQTVHPDDYDWVMQAVEAVNRTGEATTLEFRAARRDGREIWLQADISLIRFEDVDKPVQLAVLTDITERKDAEDKLRMSEASFRIATGMVGDIRIGRYDIKTRTYYHDDQDLIDMGFGTKIANMPHALVNAGRVAPECVEEYLDFYARVRRGDDSPSVDTAYRMADGKQRWIHGVATVVTDAEGQPSQAILVFTDITEQREKEAAFRKLQQDLQQRPPESFTFFRWNLSKDMSAYDIEGSLVRVGLEPGRATFNERAQEYAAQCVHPEDREQLIAFVNTDTLLANYHRGNRNLTLEYRETLAENGVRWLRLTIELIQFAQSADVEAYLTFEDIDAKKKASLAAKDLAERDLLTGVLNRIAFAAKCNEVLKENQSTRHTLLMLDIDGFKQLNDVFGHATGDQALIDIANSIRSILRHGDMMGRLGGDEFLILLRDIPYDAIVEKKAAQICTLMRRAFSMEVQISASIGIAVYPDDGEDFDALYRSADKALYRVKDSGKDGFAYYNREVVGSPNAALDAGDIPPRRVFTQATKRRMLIVDDNEMNRSLLAQLFEDEFAIETAPDGNTALIRLRHLGAAISIVLLDLFMPGLDGFAVLDKMRKNVEMRSIPVIVVSAANERETSLRAIRSGAADYITKPVDPDLIRLRVSAVISKAENERLRAQNSYLLLQNNEEVKYRTVLDSTGTVVIEYDWVNGVFSYDSSIAEHIAGNFDRRKLWRILLSDLVATAQDVKAMQDLVHTIANDRSRRNGSLVVTLKTPSGARQWFRMDVFKHSNEFQLTDRIILTFVNVNEQVITEELLRLQAENDDLTGLYNRRTFLRKVEERVSREPANTYVMCIGDIDNFKMINDRYGHAEGDRLLRYIAEVLKDDIERVDGLCGRLSNDVFATLIPNTPEALAKTQDYPRALLAKYPIRLETTFSVGYYIIDTPSMSADGMLDRASMAKQTVKGAYETKVAMYDEEMRRRLLIEQGIASTMEDALRNEQFDIYLQPQFNHANGRICGAEALVRWLRPDKSVMFLPGEFIPLFEKNGFITRLDDYVWNRVAELLRKRIECGQQIVPISVNVSRLDTHDPLLCERLLGILRKNRVPLSLFRLEITESLFEENAERLVSVINRLHEAGFLIEMDDFGSGYSSLNILKDVPVDILKLDMRFFANTQHNDRSGVILNAVMRMARWLNIPVIAEGVEAREQADYLASIGCLVIQGYLYAPPLPIPAFDEMLAKNEAEADMPKNDSRGDMSTVSKFWSMGSLDSDLFYTYMGAAMVFEYRAGNVEIVRINKQLATLMNLSSESLMPTLSLSGTHGEGFARFCEAVERTIASGEKVRVDLRQVFNDSNDETLRYTLRIMPSDSESSVLLCCVHTL